MLLVRARTTTTTLIRHVLVRTLASHSLNYAEAFLSIIAGRAIKNEYLALGTLGLTGLLTSLAMGGGKKDAHSPSDAKQTIQQVKETVKIDASSRYVAGSYRQNRWTYAASSLEQRRGAVVRITQTSII